MSHGQGPPDSLPEPIWAGKVRQNRADVSKIFELWFGARFFLFLFSPLFFLPFSVHLREASSICSNTAKVLVKLRRLTGTGFAD